MRGGSRTGSSVAGVCSVGSVVYLGLLRQQHGNGCRPPAAFLTGKPMPKVTLDDSKVDRCGGVVINVARMVVGSWRSRPWQILPEGDASKLTYAMRSLERAVDRLHRAEADA